MKTKLILAISAASAALAFTAPASAAVIGVLGGDPGSGYHALTSAGLDGGTFATLTGGTVYPADHPNADIPFGTVNDPDTNFLAAGPFSGNTATLTFTQGISSLGFRWGSPDTYNILTIVSTVGSYNFTALGLGFDPVIGDQGLSQYVTFGGNVAGEKILSATFTTDPAQDAFEVSNFAGAVPEPTTWAMMILGFGLVGAGLRRRNAKTTARIAFA